MGTFLTWQSLVAKNLTQSNLTQRALGTMPPPLSE